MGGAPLTSTSVVPFDMLKFETKVTRYVDYTELKRWLSTKLAPIDVQIGDSPNDTDYSITLESKPLDEFEQEDFDKFLTDGYINMDYGYYAILNGCCHKGWIEPGDYIIQVSW